MMLIVVLVDLGVLAARIQRIVVNNVIPDKEGQWKVLNVDAQSGFMK